MPDPVSEQVTNLTEMVQSGDYHLAYKYIADQIDGDPRWNQELPEWFRDASKINDPQPSALKTWIFTYNAIVSQRDYNNPAVWDQSQQISDDLASDIVERYRDAIENNEVLTPEQIYDTDTGAFGDGYGAPEWAWAGGPMGLDYDFPVFKNIDPYHALA